MKSDLTEFDWIQIEQAATGCVSGTSDEWPALRVVIEKITGQPFTVRRPASWLNGFCEAAMAMRGEEYMCHECGCFIVSNDTCDDCDCCADCCECVTCDLCGYRDDMCECDDGLAK